MRPEMRWRWLSEPLLHFMLIGLGLFALERGVRRTTPAITSTAVDSRIADTSSRDSIIVSADLRASIAADFARAHGSPPGPAELDAAIGRWVDEEVLYREGLRRALDREDPQVRQRIASRMGFVLEAQTVVPEPSEPELRRWFTEHPGRWAQEPIVDFTQVFVTGVDDAAQTRARELLGLLERGADPNGLGDTFSGGRRYRRRTVEDLAGAFGREFVEGLDAVAQGTWTLRRSRFGLHLVRVDSRTAARSPDFETVRLDVRRDWALDRRARAMTAAMTELRSRWTIVGAGQNTPRPSVPAR